MPHKIYLIVGLLIVLLVSAKAAEQQGPDPQGSSKTLTVSPTTVMPMNCTRPSTLSFCSELPYLVSSVDMKERDSAAEADCRWSPTADQCPFLVSQEFQCMRHFTKCELGPSGEILLLPLCRAVCLRAAQEYDCTQYSDDFFEHYCGSQQYFGDPPDCFIPMAPGVGSRFSLAQISLEIVSIAAVLLCMHTCAVLSPRGHCPMRGLSERQGGGAEDGGGEESMETGLLDTGSAGSELLHTGGHTGTGDACSSEALIEAFPDVGERMDVDEGMLECRICKADGTSDDELLSPCHCSGSMSLVHSTCLLQWLQEQERRGATDRDLMHCEVCLQPYNVVVQRRVACTWKLCSCRSWQEYINCIALLLMVPVLVFMLWFACNLNLQAEELDFCTQPGHWLLVAIGVCMLLSVILTIHKGYQRWRFVNEEVRLEPTSQSYRYRRCIPGRCVPTEEG